MARSQVESPFEVDWTNAPRDLTLGSAGRGEGEGAIFFSLFFKTLQTNEGLSENGNHHLLQSLKTYVSKGHYSRRATL